MNVNYNSEMYTQCNCFDALVGIVFGYYAE